MTEIRFYHLHRKSVEQALPELIDRAYARGHRILVRLPHEDAVARLNESLWTFRPESFLPHGTATDSKDADFAQANPIWLTTTSNDNPNKADVLIVTSGMPTPDMESYALCCDILDGQDQTQIEQGRVRWKQYKEAGHSITYWQQNDAGKWEQKA